MKKLKKGIFPLIISFHIVSRIIFSDVITNDEITVSITNLMPKDNLAENIADDNLAEPISLVRLANK